MKPTHKSYYDDPYLKRLETRVEALQAAPRGSWICTDRTIFYPGGGGQPADTGTLNGNPVEQIKTEAETIWHFVPDFAGKTGDPVQLELDFARRLYMMQQHSGQHLLSHVLDGFGLHTESVHLGESYTAIEVSGGFPDETQQQDIQRRANTLIRNNLPIRIHMADRESIQHFPLRKEAGMRDTFRVVEIDGLDFSACGGTHVKQTSEIGLILCEGVEKIRGRARLHFKIGAKALEQVEACQKQTEKIKSLLQTEAEQFPERISRLQEELRLQRKELEQVKELYLQEIQKNLIQQPDFIFFRLEPFFSGEISKLARTLAESGKKAVFIVCGQRFSLALPEGLPLNGNAFIKQQQSVFGLRGGGPPSLVQGSLQTKDDSALRLAVQTFLTQPISGGIS